MDQKREHCEKDKHFLYYELQEDKDWAREIYIYNAGHTFIFSNHTLNNLKSLLFTDKEF